MRYLLLAPALLAACTTMTPPAAPVGPCAVDEATRMRFVGAKFDSGMREELQARTNARVMRTLRPDEITTKEFFEDRLNVMLDDGRRIDGLRCG